MEEFTSYYTALIILDYEKLCSGILQVDRKIRFVAVYDKWAKRLAGGTKAGIENLLPDKVTQESVNQAIFRWESRKKMNEWVGKPKYSMAEYEKLKRFTFYLNENYLLLVTTEPDADHILILTMIQNLLTDPKFS